MCGNPKPGASQEVGINDSRFTRTSPGKTNEYLVGASPILWPAVAAILGFLYGFYDFAIGRTGEVYLALSIATTICLIGLLWHYSRRAGVALYEVSVFALSVGGYVGSHPTHPEQFRAFLYGWMIYAATGGVLLCTPKRGGPGRSATWRRLRIGCAVALVLQAGLVMAGFAQLLLIEKRPHVSFRALGNPTLRSVTFSADGNTLATVGGFGAQLKTARLWDARTGRKLAEFTDTKITGDPRLAALHFIGEHLALAIRADGHTGSIASIAVFDVEKRGVKARFPWEDGVRYRSATFSHDGTEFVYGNFDGHLKVFDLNLGKVTVDLQRKSRHVECVAVSRARDKVACAAHGDSIEVWDLSSSRQIAAFTTTANVECMDFSADGRLLACGTDAATVEVFDVVEQRRIVDTRCFGDGIVSAVAFSPNGNVLACGGSRGVTVLVDPQSGTTLGKLRMWGAWEISSISFSADGKQLATGNLRGHVAIWRLD